MMSTLANLTPSHIALIKPSALGDILHSLPVLSALRRRFPSASITWIVNTSYETLLQGHPDLHATLPFERHPYRNGVVSGLLGQRAFLGRLRRARFDLAIDLQGLFRGGLLGWLTRAPTRIGLSSAREGARVFYTHVVQDGGFSVHAVDRYWKVIEAFGDPPAHKRFVLPVSREARAWARDRLAGLPRPWLAVAAGARWLTKRWPPAHFAELVRRAQAEFGGSALFLGSPDERPLAEEAARRLKGPQQIFAGDTNLAQLIALLAAADVVLANDTGPLHIAVALGRPVVAPYTCTSVTKTGPYGQFHRAVETKVWCQGREIRTCDRLECMAELTPDRLWPVLEGILRLATIVACRTGLLTRPYALRRVRRPVLQQRELLARMATQLPLGLILASGSRGRRYLLEKAGYAFDVHPADIDEPTGVGCTDIRRFVHNTAWLKASAVAPRFTSGLVLAADTVGWIDGQVIGKPADAADARRILRTLGGREHELWTGVVLWRRPDDVQVAWQEATRVFVRVFTDSELDTYLATRQWEGCSGAYAIKEDDDPYVKVVAGSVSNVIGLPMESLARILADVATTGSVVAPM